jgi:site-specific recombinase XerD
VRKLSKYYQKLHQPPKFLQEIADNSNGDVVIADKIHLNYHTDIDIAEVVKYKKEILKVYFKVLKSELENYGKSNFGDNKKIIKLKDLFEQFINFKKNDVEKKIAESSLRRLKEDLRKVLHIYPNKDIASMFFDEFKTIKDRLKEYPLNTPKAKLLLANASGYQEVKRITKEHNLPTLENKTINKALNALKQAFDYAEMCRYIQSNPMKMRHLTLDEGASTDTVLWEDEQITMLFDNIYYLQDGVERVIYNNSYNLWILLIGMYTGARASEIGGLYTDDVYHDDGYLAIGITDSDIRDKTIKTKGSKRLIYSTFAHKSSSILHKNNLAKNIYESPINRHFKV